MESGAVIAGKERVQPPENIQAVDLVRSVAILIVVGFHLGTAGIPFKTDLLNFVCYNAFFGIYGVYMFFVVSGFLITRLIASNPRGLYQPDFREFYVRRVGRIFPLLGLVCLIGLGFMFLIHVPAPIYDKYFKIPHSSWNPFFWLSIATFWFNWYSIAFIRAPGVFWTLLWSLSVEEQFYFFYPLTLKLLSNDRNLKIFLAFFVLLGPVSLWVGYSFFQHVSLVEHNSFSGFGLIATGSLLYLFTERYRAFLLQHAKQCMGLCLAGLLLMFKIYLDQPAPSDTWGNTFHPMLFGIGVFLFLLGAMHLDFFKAKFWRPLALNGKLSYGIYLYHAMVICLAVWLFPRINEYAFFCGVPVAIFLLALFSYRFFEVPVNRFVRKRWGRRKMPRPS